MPRRHLLAICALVVVALSPALGQSTSSAKANLFANAKGTAGFPFEWREGMVVLPVSIHGSPPLHFVLDTASTRILIDRTVANSLGLKGAEADSLQGADRVAFL
jgi:hypothetical protein